MSIHEHLPPHPRKDLKQVGWAKGLELAKLARKQGQQFESATWLHKAGRMPKEEMICADFLAGVNLDGGDPEILRLSITSYFRLLPSAQQDAFQAEITEEAS